MLFVSMVLAGLGLIAVQPAASPVTVTITESAAPPDAQVVLPVGVSLPEGTQLGTLELRLAFPSEPLTFVKIEPSGLAVSVGANVTADVKEGGSAGTSVLHAVVSTIGDGGSRKPLADGPIAYLTFKIAKTATQESSIALSPEATLRSLDGTPLAPVATSPAKIGVASEPVPACFFYMH